MWIISKTGFVSLVEHDTDPDLIRARARRPEHLTGTFNVVDVIDLGPNAPDYRYHCNVDRGAAAAAIANAVLDVDYSSHVKEEVAGNDRVFYSAMLGCWKALYALQDPPRFDDDDDRWTTPTTDEDAPWAWLVDKAPDVPPRTTEPWEPFFTDNGLPRQRPVAERMDEIVEHIHEFGAELRARDEGRPLFKQEYPDT